MTAVWHDAGWNFGRSFRPVQNFPHFATGPSGTGSALPIADDLPPFGLGVWAWCSAGDSRIRYSHSVHQPCDRDDVHDNAAGNGAPVARAARAPGLRAGRCRQDEGPTDPQRGGFWAQPTAVCVPAPGIDVILRWCGPRCPGRAAPRNGLQRVGILPGDTQSPFTALSEARMANQPSRGKSPGVVRQCMSTPNRWRGSRNGRVGRGCPARVVADRWSKWTRRRSNGDTTTATSRCGGRAVRRSHNQAHGNTATTDY